MPLLKRSQQNILESIQDDFDEAGNNAVRVAGTPEHLIASVTAHEIAILYNSLEYAHSGLRLSSATAVDLDHIAEIVGITRNQSQTPQDISGQNIKFYVSPRYVGDAQDLAAQIGLVDLVIPAGTEVTDGSNRTYYVTEAVTFGDDQEEGVPVYTHVFANVSAYASGSQANVNTGDLVQHNLSAHPQLSAVAANIEVTNLLPVTNGQEVESDNDLRFRITQAFTARARANNTSVLEAARSVPGVANAFIIPNIYGTGTFGVSVDASVPILSPGIIQAVQAAVDNVKAAGTRAYVLYPEYIGIRITIEIIFNHITDAEKETTRTAIKAAIVDYVNNLNRGDTLVMNQVIARTVSPQGIKNAQIVKLVSGDYNVLSKEIENSLSLLAVDQVLGNNQKWFTAGNLIELCEVI
jgi:uncharacterized phage protein gp47/JayE